MIRTILISTVLVGVGGLSVWPSIATVSTPSETEVYTRLIEVERAGLEIELANEPSFHSHRFIVQRKSSSPQGESHTGRASSSPAGKVPESGRDSGRKLDPTESLSPLENDRTSHQRPEESKVTPKREGDPLEGGKKSQPATKRRGGVVK
jgi:hypothetical protein